MRRPLVVFAAIVLLGAACVSGGDSEDDLDRICGRGPTVSEQPAALSMADALTDVWSFSSDEATFSSPRTSDLNGDGVLDIVQGFGQDTFGDRESSVRALDGATGELIWRSTGHEDIIGSATFVSLTSDETLDVVIGGRRGALLALDGSTGDLLWEFDDQGGRWFNFYTSQVLPDQDGDDVVDLLAANGGLVFDEPEEGGGVPDPDERHLGTIFVVSGADGSVIASSPVPDRRESYMSPVVLPARGGAEVEVLIGTGGETLPGSVWKWPLPELLERDTEAAIAVVAGGEKGVIASPVVADFTGDCISDIVVQAFDGTVSLTDGATGDEVWRVENNGFETYSTPALGFFVGDDGTPDVFTSVARGVWPDYESSDYLLIDGASGEVAWRETLGTFAPSGFVAADLNADGRDEVIFGVNDVEADTQQFFVLDATSGEAHRLGEPFDQTTFAAPWLGDIDDDGRLDLIVTQSSYLPPTRPSLIRRLSLAWPAPDTVSWGGFLGTRGTAVVPASEAS